ncbi:MAG: hypothetical protein GXO78_13795 [Calditrichaeota bacterium]|nr:hypothetical protein [Calditrichota bacterium]
MKFLCDSMLIGLARYLRFLGHDVEVVSSFPDAHRRYTCFKDRIFLTTSPAHWHLWPGTQKHLIPSGRLEEQFRQLCQTLPILQDLNFLSRCSRCNVAIEPVEKAAVKQVVPEKVYQWVDQFYRCPSCQRVYWEGGHVVRLKEKLRRLGVPLD